MTITYPNRHPNSVPFRIRPNVTNQHEYDRLPTKTSSKNPSSNASVIKKIRKWKTFFLKSRSGHIFTRSGQHSPTSPEVDNNFSKSEQHFSDVKMSWKIEVDNSFQWCQRDYRNSVQTRAIIMIKIISHQTSHVEIQLGQDRHIL